MSSSESDSNSYDSESPAPGVIYPLYKSSDEEDEPMTTTSSFQVSSHQTSSSASVPTVTATQPVIAVAPVTVTSSQAQKLSSEPQHKSFSNSPKAERKLPRQPLLSPVSMSKILIETEQGGDSIHLTRKNPNQNESSNSISSSKELFLDTKGSCFLCLKEISGAEDNGDIDKELMTEVSFRNICRYLNINPSFILVKSLKGDLLNEEDREEAVSQRNKCNFTVTLCMKCSSLSRKIIELIRQEETIKMQMEHKIQEFNHILIESESETNRSQWKKFQDKMSISATPVETNLVELLRKETKEKASRRHRHLTASSTPKILLEDFNRVVSSSQNSTFSTSSNSNVTTSSAATVDILKESEDHSETDEIYKVPISTLCNDSPKEWITETCADHCKKLPGNRYQCPFCPSVCSNSNIRFHLIVVHLNKFFAQKIFPQFSEDEPFRKFCKHILRKQINKADTGDMELVKKFLCSHCKVKYTKPGFQYHFVMEHCDILERMVQNFRKGSGVKLSNPPTPKRPSSYQVTVQNHNGTPPLPLSQKDPSSSDCKKNQEDLAGNKDSKCYTPNDWMTEIITKHCENAPSNQYQCPFCKSVKPSEVEIRFHLVFIHLEKYFENIIPSTLPEIAIALRNNCKRVLYEETKKARAVQIASSPGQGALFCTLCDRKYSTEYCFIYHFILKHYPIMEAKLLPLLDLQSDGDGSPSTKNGNNAICASSSQTNEVNRGRGRPRKEKLVHSQDKPQPDGEKGSQAVKRKLDDQENNDRDLNLMLNHYSIMDEKALSEGPPEWNLSMEQQIKIVPGTTGERKALTEKAEQVQNFTEISKIRKVLQFPTSESKGSTATASPPAKDLTSRSHHQFIPDTKSNLSPTSSTTSDSKEKQMISAICSSHLKKAGNRYKCGVCSKRFPPSAIRIRTHIVSAHPENFFSAKKLMHLSEDQIQTNCKRILSAEAQYAKQRVDSSSPEKELYLCGYCSLKISNIDDFNYHLVLEHYAIIEEKLENSEKEFEIMNQDSQQPDQITKKDITQPSNDIESVRQDNQLPQDGEQVETTRKGADMDCADATQNEFYDCDELIEMVQHQSDRIILPEK